MCIRAKVEQAILRSALKYLAFWYKLILLNTVCPQLVQGVEQSSFP